MAQTVIGGWPVETLTCAAPAAPDAPVFVRADIAPARGMLLLQARVRRPDGGETELLACPPLDRLPGLFGGEDDFCGNKSFAFGAAILLPYANRIRGRATAEGRWIETQVLGRTVRLPRNWGGRAPGAEQYAMHGLMLDRAPDRLERRALPSGEALAAAFELGDFGGCWPSSTRVEVEISLQPSALRLQVRATNVGEALLPVGIGWHPYFALPSGERAQARLRLPARGRAEVGDYDAVLPTGRTLPLAGGPYDFRAADGSALGELYLDDCFVGLERDAAGEVVALITDPAAGHGVRVRARSPEISAVQVFAPPSDSYVVVEPQFNWADPFGPEWGGQDTGMVVLRPGSGVLYDVAVEPFAP